MTKRNTPYATIDTNPYAEMLETVLADRRRLKAEYKKCKNTEAPWVAMPRYEYGKELETYKQKIAILSSTAKKLKKIIKFKVKLNDLVLSPENAEINLATAIEFRDEMNKNKLK